MVRSGKAVWNRCFMVVGRCVMVWPIVASFFLLENCCCCCAPAPALLLFRLRSDLQSARQMAMSGSDSTIVRRFTGQQLAAAAFWRRAAGQPLAAAYEARNVFITNLPEVLLLNLHERTAAQVYHEWQQCEVIIGKRPRRGWHASPAGGGHASRWWQ